MAETSHAVPAQRESFFVSYVERDQGWATWIAAVLEGEGHSVFVRAWDVRPGHNAVIERDRAARAATRTIAVWSPAYFEAPGGEAAEWAAALRADPAGTGRLLIPVLVEKCDVPGLSGNIVPIDLRDRDESEARAVLLRGVRPGRIRPEGRPRFPGGRRVRARAEPAPVFPGGTGTPPAGPAAPARAARTVPRGAWDASWRGGDEITLGGATFLLSNRHGGDLPQRYTDDRGALWRQAKALQRTPVERPVWLRQVVVRSRETSAANAWLRAIRGEERLLGELEDSPGLPRLLDADHDGTGAHTVVHTLPVAPTLKAVYGPAETPLDPLRVVRLLRCARSLCAALAALHRRGFSHRDLTPGSIIIAGGHRAVLRDLGLATWLPVPGEGPDVYRSPEQARRQDAPPGPHTDVYQLAAILYHVITGQAPGGAVAPPPPSSLCEGVPPTVDEALMPALAPAARDRGGDVRRLGARLDAAARRLR